ncbi:putative amino-acid permease C15C4.04c [Grifola frondosa]|uniref:Putative amino-acid permease C15C4.04c n=1 Tax=Grifola frondosa TaxID=5627 RepID=A0A1C7MDB6_GRIFR|nr:putative amino-acid permease C15C4.04c [Grifola frondosa]
MPDGVLRCPDGSSGVLADSVCVQPRSRPPDRDYFGHISTWTKTPLRAIWLTTITSILPGLLDLASPIALNAIFALTAMALDLSYIIPIFLRRWYRNHPEVNFKPGPFYMGDGLLGWAANVNCILWTLFVVVIFSMPTILPVTKDNMNYASVITGGVIILSFVWYFAGRVTLTTDRFNSSPIYPAGILPRAVTTSARRVQR